MKCKLEGYLRVDVAVVGKKLNRGYQGHKFHVGFKKPSYNWILKSQGV